MNTEALVRRILHFWLKNGFESIRWKFLAFWGMLGGGEYISTYLGLMTIIINLDYAHQLIHVRGMRKRSCKSVVLSTNFYVVVGPKNGLAYLIRRVIPKQVEHEPEAIFDNDSTIAAALGFNDVHLLDRTYK